MQRLSCQKVLYFLMVGVLLAVASGGLRAQQDSASQTLAEQIAVAGLQIQIIHDALKSFGGIPRLAPPPPQLGTQSRHSPDF